MHATLEAIKDNLEKVISQIETKIPNDEPFGPASNNWSFPGLTKSELAEDAQELVDLIEEKGGENLGGNEARLNDYLRRLEHLQNQTIPQLWGNAGQAVSAYILTLQGLRRALAPSLTRDIRAENSSKLRSLAKQIRAMELRINSLEPRTESVSIMVDRIEEAYNAADQLPTDLETLKESRQEIIDLVRDSSKDRERIAEYREKAGRLDAEMTSKEDQARAVLAKCETAYSAATSVGLAAAFSERSSALSKSMWIWVTGLILALGIGSYFGFLRVQNLSETLKDPTAHTPMIAFNLALSLLTIGAPVWFSWLATKQIGQRFRLSEDYAFKASVSRAYEGFRREAARFDKEMESQLLASALCRLDELPLRLVEPESHGSPLHELASSDAFRQALKTIPGFTDQLKQFAYNSIAEFSRLKPKKPPEDSVQKADNLE